MLKAIMLRREIERKNAELEQLRETEKTFETREKDLTTAIEEAETQEQRDAVSAEEIGRAHV